MPKAPGRSMYIERFLRVAADGEPRQEVHEPFPGNTKLQLVRKK